jgi:chitinase
MKYILTFLFIYILTCPLTAGNVIGYFTNWGIYGEHPYKPENVPYDKLTHIQYAFFNPQTSGDIATFDADADAQILEGKMLWYPKEEHDSTTSLIYLAHKKNVKVLASIGGWTGSNNFPALASSAATRTRFCTQARALIERYNFDGIDIDWEYPCSPDHNGTPADAQNFVVLLSELRDTLDAMSGAKKLVTLAIAGSAYHGKNFLIEQFYQDVDYISIMTYDYTGAWDSKAWHSSPLYDYGDSENWSLNRSMEYYKARGVPLAKFNIGLAFYGKTFAGCNGPNASFTGAGSGQEPGSLDYSEITVKIQNGEYIRHWDSTALVPYCLSSSNEYCSYDDTISIRKKVEYCVEKGYAGAIIWELKTGTLNDGSSPLLDAAANVLLPSSAVVKRYHSSPEFLSLNKPTNGIVKNTAFFYLNKPSDVTISIYDVSGRLVKHDNQFHGSGSHIIQLPSIEILAAGKYVTKIETKEFCIQQIFNNYRK